MDIMVTWEDARWILTDLLGRAMGSIVQGPDAKYSIHAEGHAKDTFHGLKAEGYYSLDEALADIERHTRGVCRRVGGAEHQ